jgi:hypothetical protein
MPIRVRITLPQDEVTPLLDVLKAHKGEILNDPYSLSLKEEEATLFNTLKKGDKTDGKRAYSYL